jgi:hypothetical protein
MHFRCSRSLDQNLDCLIVPGAEHNRLPFLENKLPLAVGDIQCASRGGGKRDGVLGEVVGRFVVRQIVEIGHVQEVFPASLDVMRLAIRKCQRGFIPHELRGFGHQKHQAAIAGCCQVRVTQSLVFSFVMA